MANIKQKVLVGKVVSDKMDKSRVVAITRRVKHPLYNKIINKTTKYMIHDDKNESRLGDKVEIIYFRPISKDKCWKLFKIVEKAAIL